MKIALITDGIYPYVIGGMQKHSYYIAKYLAKNGIGVDLYHTGGNEQYDISKLEVFTDAEKQYINSIVVDFPPPGSIPGHYLRRSFRYSEKIYAILRNRLDVDFIYVKGFAGWKLMKEKEKGVKYPPIGIKFHGLNMFQQPPSFRGRLEYMMLRPPARYNLRHADYVFSYGGKITEITKKIGVPDSRIIEIPTGIEATAIGSEIVPTTGVRKFLFIGRYERLKGIQELSRCIKQLGKGHDFEFHFVGPVPENLQLRSSGVKYWGQLNTPEEVTEVIRKCDVLACPSYSEGMPNAIIEAMANGLAVIATDVGAINYLVSRENGWLIDYCSVENIASAMKKAISIDNQKLDELKRNSLRFTRENLVWDKIAERLIGALKRVGSNH